MNLRYLKTFVAVAQHGNFARAANAVGLTQSAVSMQMRALENLMGRELFDRSKRPATLNEAGESLVPKAREIIELFGQMVKDVVGPENLPGVLHLGAVRSTLTGIVPRALATVRSQFPTVGITVVGGLPGELSMRVEQGDLDAALVSEPRYVAPHLRWRPVMDEPLVLIAPADASGDDSEELLAGQPYVALNRGDWGGRAIDEYLLSLGLVLKPVLEFDSFEAVIMAVQRGYGVSILHQGCIDHPLRSMLRCVPLGPKPPVRTLGVLDKPTTQRAPIIDNLTAELARIASEQRDIWLPLRMPAFQGSPARTPEVFKLQA